MKSDQIISKLIFHTFHAILSVFIFNFFFQKITKKSLATLDFRLDIKSIATKWATLCIKSASLASLITEIAKVAKHHHVTTLHPGVMDHCVLFCCDHLGFLYHHAQYY